MPSLLALFLSLCGCGPRPVAEAPPDTEGQTTPMTAPASPASEVMDRQEPAKPADPFAPFPVRSQLEVPLPDRLFAGGFERRGGGTAPVNTEEEDRDFFTDPAFDKEKNTGRLFSTEVSLFNRYEPKLPERSVAFICWRPLSADSPAPGATIAQLLPWREGYSIYEVTTDGKQLLVQFEPAYGTSNPGRPLDIYVWKGDTHGNGRFVPKGNKPFPKIAAVSPSDAESERQRGFDAITAQKYSEAVEAFEAAIKRKPNDAAAHYGLGLAYIGPGQPAGSEDARKAIAAFTKAVALDPKRADAWRERSVLYWSEKQYDKAISDTSKVIDLEPKEAQGYIRKAQFLAESGALEKAIATVQTATRLGPEEREYWEILALFQYRAGHYDEALKSTDRALDQDDSRNVSRLVRAYIYARRDQTEKALGQIKEAYDNGIAYSEREDGAKEIRKALRAQPKSAALNALYRAVCRNDSFAEE
ncbi:MAG: tetratricopeptide repeat protein [Armatimonadota bacterium]